MVEQGQHVSNRRHNNWLAAVDAREDPVVLIALSGVTTNEDSSMDASMAIATGTTQGLDRSGC